MNRPRRQWPEGWFAYLLCIAMLALLLGHAAVALALGRTP